MKKTLALGVAALALVGVTALAGCAHRGDRAARGGDTGSTQQTVPAGPATAQQPGGGTTTTSTDTSAVDNDLSSVDSTLSGVDSQLADNDKTPEDSD